MFFESAFSLVLPEAFLGAVLIAILLDLDLGKKLVAVALADDASDRIFEIMCATIHLLIQIFLFQVLLVFLFPQAVTPHRRLPPHFVSYRSALHPMRSALLPSFGWLPCDSYPHNI